jgi:uncharacterized membrane protein YeaQ/YmgE (transglycosylase-associated protein family)
MTYADEKEMDPTGILISAVAGAAAGVLAVWVMDRFDWFAYNHEPEEARQQTSSARPDGMDPAHIVADKVAGVVGKEVSQPSPAGIAVHYSIGIMPGALYGAVHDRFPAIGTGRGSLFGLGLFLLQDEGLNALAGLSGKPQEYPWQAHARGLMAHLVYGTVTDAALRFFKKAL